MTKEEILSTTKELVLFIRDHIKDNKDKTKSEWFHNQIKMLEEESKKLNSCDLLWLDDKYGKWLKNTFGSDKITLK